MFLRKSLGLALGLTLCSSVAFAAQPVIESVVIDPIVDMATVKVIASSQESSIAQVECLFDEDASWDEPTPAYLADNGYEWECITHSPAGGVHTVEVRAIDQAGVISAVAGPYEFTFEHRPRFDLESGQQELLPRNGVRISGRVDDADGDLSYVEYRVVKKDQENNIEYDWQNWVRADGVEEFAFELNELETGTYLILFRAWDEKGNQNIAGFGDISMYVIPFCEAFSATNQQHVTAGRATEQTSGYWWTVTKKYYAVGSGEELGGSSTTTNVLSESPEGYFFKGNCPVADKTAPQLTLNGANPMQVAIGGEFVEPGFTAVDALDGDVAFRVEVEGEVDTTVEGSYTLTYTVTDNIGNLAQATRTVLVAQAPACADWSATLQQHTTAGRAYTTTQTTGQTCWGVYCWGGTTTTTWFAQGSDQNLGTNGSDVVSLKEEPVGSGVFTLGQCPAGPSAPVVSFNTNHPNPIYQMQGRVDIRLAVTDLDQDIASLVMSDGLVCTIAGSDTYVDNTLYFNCNYVGLPAGEYALTAIATDESGLQSVPFPVNFTVVYGGAEPVLESWTLELNGKDLTIRGTASDADNNIQAVSFVAYIPFWSSCTGTTEFVCYAPNLPAGTHSISLQVMDTGGNVVTYNNIDTVTVADAPTCVTDTNANHATAGRATMQYNILYYAVGSNDYLGLGTASTSLQETAPGNWTKVASCQ